MVVSQTQTFAMFWLVFLTNAMFGVACTVQLPLGDNRYDDAGVLIDAGSVITAESFMMDSETEPDCRLENLTQLCECNRDGEIVPGRRTCESTGNWSQCECVKAPNTIIKTNNTTSEPKENKGSERFDWGRTRPNSDKCLAGIYVGVFSCELQRDTIPHGTISGPVSFTLEESPNGEYLFIESGTLLGQPNFGMVFVSNLSGALDCSIDTFHAEVVDGIFGVPPFIFGAFGGVLEAPLDRKTQTLTGTWSFSNVFDPAITCVGPWSAVRQ